jgi:AcrR family transcriptional regulator
MTLRFSCRTPKWQVHLQFRAPKTIHVTPIDMNQFGVSICDMNMQEGRKYEMKARSASAAQTEANILKAAGELWLKFPLHEITLERIAEKAETTVRTILRKFGSREGLFISAIGKDVAGIEAIKDAAEVGNLPLAVDLLMKEYEATGEAGVRLLALEDELPSVAQVLQHARKIHTAWCARVFAPYLPSEADPQYRLLLGMYYASTDVNQWKLLRKDLGYSQEETAQILLQRLNAITLIKIS